MSKFTERLGEAQLRFAYTMPFALAGRPLHAFDRWLLGWTHPHARRALDMLNDMPQLPREWGDDETARYSVSVVVWFGIPTERGGLDIGVDHSITLAESADFAEATILAEAVGKHISKLQSRSGVSL